MASSSLKAFIDVSFSEKLDKAKIDGVEADPVMEPLLKILAEGQILKSKDEMAAHLQSDKVTKFKPLGKIFWTDFRQKFEFFIFR